MIYKGNPVSAGIAIGSAFVYDPKILTAPEDFSAVRETLEKEGIPMAEAEVRMIPQNYVTLTDETAIKNLQRTLDLLDEDDDVQNVFHNWDE